MKIYLAVLLSLTFAANAFAQGGPPPAGIYEEERFMALTKISNNPNNFSLSLIVRETSSTWGLVFDPDTGTYSYNWDPNEPGEETDIGVATEITRSSGAKQLGWKKTIAVQRYGSPVDGNTKIDHEVVGYNLNGQRTNFNPPLKFSDEPLN